MGTKTYYLNHSDADPNGYQLPDDLPLDQVQEALDAKALQLKAAQATQAETAVPGTPFQPPDKSAKDFATRALPQSAVKAVTGAVHGVTHPIDTIKGILSIAGLPLTGATYGAVSGLEGLTNAAGIPFLKGASDRYKQEYIQPALDFGQSMSDRYGGLFGGKEGWGITPQKWAENVGNTLYNDPVGAALDASMFTGAGANTLKARRAGLGVPGAASSVAASAPSMMERILGVTSKVTDPIGMTVEGVKKLGNLAGQAVNALTREGIGKTTGAGGEALSTAYDVGKESTLNPSNFTAEAQKRLADAMAKARTPEETVALAREGISNMRQNASTKFEDAKTNPNDGWMHDRTTLNFSPVRKAWADVYSTLFDKDTGIPIVKESELTQIDKIGELITQWEANPSGHTLGGLDNLKRAIRNFKGGLEDKQVERVVTGLSNEVQNIAKTQSDIVYAGKPNKYRDSMKEYETHMNDLDEMERSLSLGKRASIDTTARKLMSIMRDNVNTNFGQRIKNVEKLEDKGGIDLRPEIAGHALSSLAPRGIAGGVEGALALPFIGGGAALGQFLPALATLAATAPLASPRVMGKTANIMGKTAGLTSRYGDLYGIPGSLDAAKSLVGHPGMLTGTLSNRTQPGQPGNEIVMPPITVHKRGGYLRTVR